MFHHNLRNNHAPQKFEKRPCSIQKLIWPCLVKIWETTMLHKNLRSDHAPSKNFRSDHANLRNDHVPPEFEAICHILGEHGHINFSMEHGHFSNFCGAWSFLKFCWNMVVSIFFWWSMVAFQIFWWSMVACQIFVEHGRFSNFGGTLSFLLFLVEHGPFSNFLAPVISLSLVTNML